MNVLYCDKFSMKNINGGTIHIYEVIKGLSRLGYKITILNRDFEDDERHIKQKSLAIFDVRRTGLNWREWPMISKFKGEISFLGILAAELSIFVTAFFTIVKKHRHFDVIYRRHAVINSEWILSRIFKIPYVLEINGIVSDELRMVNWGGPFSLWLVNKIERYTLSRANMIIAVTPNLKDILSVNYSLKTRRIAIVQNGADTELFHPMDSSKARETLNLNKENNYICFVGNLFPWQGVECAISCMPEILAPFPKARLLIVGNGPLKEELVDLARHLDVIESLKFVGEVPHHKVPLYINASDICIAPKLGLKSGYSPLKLCEYMACKKPVVGSRASGLELVEESRGGILVEPGNIHELAGTICMLLNSQELREQMGENGRRFVLENQSWAMVSKRVASVLDDSISKASHLG